MRSVVIPIVALAALAGCAKAPEAIMPAYVSEVGYQSWTCQQLAEETLRVSLALTTASAQQNQARTNDTVGVILIGLPVSSLSGDNIAPQIAQLKGEQDAVRKAMITKQCAPPMSSTPKPVQTKTVAASQTPVQPAPTEAQKTQ